VLLGSAGLLANLHVTELALLSAKSGLNKALLLLSRKVLLFGNDAAILVLEQFALLKTTAGLVGSAV